MRSTKFALVGLALILMFGLGAAQEKGKISGAAFSVLRSAAEKYR